MFRRRRCTNFRCTDAKPLPNIQVLINPWQRNVSRLSELECSMESGPEPFRVYQ